MLRPRGPRERIVAVADAGSVGPAGGDLDADRASPHLAHWGLAAQADDGIVFARATVRGVPVLVAAQDERFLGGSIGARHGDALRALFEQARVERPAAVILLMASAGVRLHEANPAQLALARALAALFDLRVAGVPVLALAAGDVFGGASILACAADRLALLPGVAFGLSGPRVIEAALGRGEIDAGDAAAVAQVFGAAARAAAGHAALVADDDSAVREWIAGGIADRSAFAAATAAMQARLEARLAPGAGVVAPHMPLPRALKPLFARAHPADGAGWLWRIGERNVWLTRAFGVGTFGPREACALDAALLGLLAGGRAGTGAVLFIVGDSCGHEASRAAEALCISQYLAQHTAVLALLRGEGVRQVGLLAGTGHSGAFFANALQAGAVYAVPDARVVAMAPAAIAHVLRLDPARLAARIGDDPLVGQPVRHFAAWGGIAGILPDLDGDRLLALAAPAPRG